MPRLAVWLVLGACTPRPGPNPPASTEAEPHEHQPGPVPVTGSGTLVAHGSVLYGVNAWDDTVVRTDTGSGSSEQLVLDGEPTRIALAGDAMWISLRDAGAVAILDDLEETARMDVGPEPYGVVASSDGSRVYVALSQANEVVEIDAMAREITRTWAVGDDPRWLAIHPTDRTLYVGYAFGPVFTEIGLDDDTFVDHELPRTWRADTPTVGLSGRITGDPSVGPRGDRLLLPLLYADTGIPMPEDPYGRSGVDRINPAVASVGLAPEDGAVEEVFLPMLVDGFDLSGPVRGIVSQVTFAEEAQGLALAMLQPCDTVALVDLAHPAFDAPGGGFTTATFAAIEVAGNPSAVAWTAAGEAWVQEQGTRTVARLPLAEILDVYEPLRRDTFHADQRLQAGTSRLEPLVEEGRRLFYARGDRSCSTCHVEGRSDGLSWLVDGEMVSTPSLDGVSTPALEDALKRYGDFSDEEMGALEAWLRSL